MLCCSFAFFFAWNRIWEDSGFSPLLFSCKHAQIYALFLFVSYLLWFRRLLMTPLCFVIAFVFVMCIGYVVKSRRWSWRYFDCMRIHGLSYSNMWSLCVVPHGQTGHTASFFFISWQRLLDILLESCCSYMCCWGFTLSGQHSPSQSLTTSYRCFFLSYSLCLSANACFTLLHLTISLRLLAVLDCWKWWSSEQTTASLQAACYDLSITHMALNSIPTRRLKSSQTRSSSAGAWKKRWPTSLICRHIHFVTSARGESKRSHTETRDERKGDDDADDESDETTSSAKPPNQAHGKRSAKRSRKSEAPPAAAASSAVRMDSRQPSSSSSSSYEITSFWKRGWCLRTRRSFFRRPLLNIKQQHYGWWGRAALCKSQTGRRTKRPS